MIYQIKSSKDYFVGLIKMEAEFSWIKEQVECRKTEKASKTVLGHKRRNQRTTCKGGGGAEGRPCGERDFR